MTLSEPPSESYLDSHPWSFGYQPRLSPRYVQLALALAGREPVEIGSCCELAFGHGISLVIHAAANPGIKFAGTDFNPLHYEFAKRLAADDVPNLTLHGLSFSKFFEARHGGPPFDVVAMTGTWSWLPETEQRRVLRFLRVGLGNEGVFCHDNMVLPGNTEASAIRHMLLSFATLDPPASPGNPARAIPAVKRAIELLDTNPRFLNLFEDSRKTLEYLLNENPERLTHEFFNYNWTARHFTETARMMGEAGLGFAASWSLSQASAMLQFTQRQLRFLATIESDELREQVKDCIQFRSIRFDMWSRRGSGAGATDALKRLEQMSLIAARPLKDFGWVAGGSAGEFDLDRSAFGPVVELVAAGEPVSIATLREAGGASLAGEDLLMLIAVLIDNAWALPVQPKAAEIEAAREGCRAVNTRILAIEGEGKPIRALASPVTGAGVEVPAPAFRLPEGEAGRSVYAFRVCPVRRKRASARVRPLASHSPVARPNSSSPRRESSKLMPCRSTVNCLLTSGRC